MSSVRESEIPQSRREPAPRAVEAADEALRASDLPIGTLAGSAPLRPLARLAEGTQTAGVHGSARLSRQPNLLTGRFAGPDGVSAPSTAVGPERWGFRA